MKDINELLNKYEVSVLRNINKENVNKILTFLEKENCDFIDDIVCDYLDLFIIGYDEFVKKYNSLNKKYNYEFLKLASEDMNLLEEFYLD